MMEIEPVVVQNADDIVDKHQFTIEILKYYSGHSENSKKLEWTSKRIQSVIKLLDDFYSVKSHGRRQTSKQYHASKYNVMNVVSQKIILMKRKDISDPIVKLFRHMIITTEFMRHIFLQIDFVLFVIYF